MMEAARYGKYRTELRQAKTITATQLDRNCHLKALKRPPPLARRRRRVARSPEVTG
jgi:hypothetical protein